jgi:hypothetical protein
MLFNAPSPKGTNHAGLFLTPAGHLVDRHGQNWGRSSIARMALDTELDGMTPSPPANEDDGSEEKLKALRIELERLIDVDGLNLGEKARGAIIRLLGKHCPDTWHRDGGAKAKDAKHRRAHDEDDGEGRPDIKALRKYLHENTGLSWDVIEDACTLAEQRGEVSDELPVSGSGHALAPRDANGVIKKHRDPGEKIFQASDSTACLAKFPDMQRIGVAVPGNSQYDGQHVRRARRTRQLAADAASPDAGAKLAEKFGEHFASVKVGEWAR